jgi:predicted GNAT family acetyltransferase/glutaredoxin
MSITMYGADWCGDCRRAKAWFAENEVEYTYFDLIEHPDEVEVVLARNGGVQKIPVIIFTDDSHLVEPTNDDLAAKLAELALQAADSTSPAAKHVVVDNADSSRFEMTLAGELLSIADYTVRENSIIVPHVETNPAHRGQGNAARLMDGMLAQLRAEGRTIVPLCSFAAGHIQDNPDHHDLLA